ncbi:flagellar hook-basal body complex protein [Caenimonas koreensis DSM 17982]|uniref:Flagellar hook-basal body complex protein n=1 Tax=Caenimonas koreensis DSM 17982 TaxID=1121255 RepID=A0A844AXA7_9BURK|nr:flagellar hook-basal body protein [Caenimonas koreensis]MRD48694.1 flagellar hook-basal body complex protein [Caenimonas koreensis DSM 17982]
MNEILGISLQSMQGDMARVEQVAMNLANTLTPGYKRGITTQAPVVASFASQLGAMDATAADTIAMPLARIESTSDSRVGTLKFTGQPFDLALAGKGFFEVMTGDGPAYTRNGTFHVDARGRLVTDKGHAVMGTGGEITPGTASPVIDVTGAVRTSTAADATTLARIKVVEFDNATSMTRLSDGLFAPGTGMKPVADAEVQLRQGYVENSNVNSAREMTQLVTSMRHFETMQKVVQGWDDMLGNAIRKLGDN